MLTISLRFTQKNHAVAKIYISFVDQQLTLVSSSAVSEDILQDRFVAFVNVFERVLLER